MGKKLLKPREKKFWAKKKLFINVHIISSEIEVSRLSSARLSSAQNLFGSAQLGKSQLELITKKQSTLNGIIKENSGCALLAKKKTLDKLQFS